MESIQKSVSFGGNDHSYTFAFCRRYVHQEDDMSLEVLGPALLADPAV